MSSRGIFQSHLSLLQGPDERPGGACQIREGAHVMSSRQGIILPEWCATHPQKVPPTPVYFGTCLLLGIAVPHQRKGVLDFTTSLHGTLRRYLSLTDRTGHFRDSIHLFPLPMALAIAS